MTRNFKPIGEASNWMRLLVLCAGLLAMPLVAQAQEPSRHLQGIEVEQLPGQQVQLRLRMDGTAPQPMAFTIDNPARISLDLPDTGLALDQRRKEVGVGVVNSVVAAEAGGKTRVVLNLSTLVGYETFVEGNSIIVKVGGGEAVAERGYWSQSAMAEPAPVMAAHVSKPLFYRHFKNKQDVFEVVIERVFTDWHEAMTLEVAREGGTTSEALRWVRRAASSRALRRRSGILTVIWLGIAMHCSAMVCIGKGGVAKALVWRASGGALSPSTTERGVNPGSARGQVVG